jgi:hypothetical protein
MRMNLMVSNAQMPLNKLNKSRGMLVRNLFRKGKEEINAKEEEKDLREKEKIEYPKNIYIGNNIILYYIENNIIFNLVCYSE